MKVYGFTMADPKSQTDNRSGFGGQYTNPSSSDRLPNVVRHKDNDSKRIQDQPTPANEGLLRELYVFYNKHNPWKPGVFSPPPWPESLEPAVREAQRRWPRYFVLVAGAEYGLWCRHVSCVREVLESVAETEDSSSGSTVRPNNGHDCYASRNCTSRSIGDCDCSLLMYT